MDNRIMFASDYQEGAHPDIIKRLSETNFISVPGYGMDEFCLRAKDRIRQTCHAPNAEIEFLSGGTQTNRVMIDALLKSYEGVISADSGHVNAHEAGAIESGGHKVLTIKGHNGKITAEQIEQYICDYEHDDNHEHMVHPGMVYLSQPTEYGTLYSLSELQAIHEVCHKHHIYLYVDGARLAYALACKENDVSLSNLAELCDAFYIGGTKCGALIGEAVVIPDPSLIPHLFTIIKAHGALLAKGRLLGIQFDELFKDDLYMHIGESAITYADEIRKILTDNHYTLCFDSPTNQVFFVIDNQKLDTLNKYVQYGFWEKYDDNKSIIRFATSWATKEDDIMKLKDIMHAL